MDYIYYFKFLSFSMLSVIITKYIIYAKTAKRLLLKRCEEINMKYFKILSVILIISICFFGCTSSKPQVVKISPQTLNYGIVYVGSSVDLQFKISNNTAKIYDITNIEITGADASDFSIKSGWSGSITLKKKSRL